MNWPSRWYGDWADQREAVDLALDVLGPSVLAEIYRCQAGGLVPAGVHGRPGDQCARELVGDLARG